jgi:hypothetical protein
VSCKQECPTCERLQRLAVEIVTDGDGVDSLSLAALSERSGLSRIEVNEHYATAAACLYDAYEATSKALFGVVADAFGECVSWGAGFEMATRALLERVAANPPEARLCLVEAPRVDRELRGRCERRRREVVEFLAGEHDRRRQRDGLSAVQIELLVGASFHAISRALSEGSSDELFALEPELTELAGVFEPAVAA